VQKFDCRYIVQIGDTGGHTHTSLFPQSEDSQSSSAVFDLFYGYRTLHKGMTIEEIEQTVENFAQAARRVRQFRSARCHQPDQHRRD
jgi:2,4-dienoyl-CoA reductase (NADPH2)